MSAVVDSSIWVSFFAKDNNFKIACTYLKRIKNHQIVLPELIYCEVMISLHKLSVDESVIRKAENYFLKDLQVEFANLDTNFMFKKMPKYFKKCKAKTSDLMIIAFAIDINAAKFYTLDKKQLNYFYECKRT